MAVYCDPLLTVIPTAVWRWDMVSHLFTDSDDLDELHRFARRIGLRREWFQHKPGRLPHYDLNPSKQAVAITAGAQLLTRAEAVAKWREIRERKPTPTAVQTDLFDTTTPLQ